MKLQKLLHPSKNSQASDQDAVVTAPKGQVVALESLTVTPQRTAEQIRQAIRAGRVAEMDANEAGA